MTIGFFYVDNGTEAAAATALCARALVRSAHEVMPHTPVVQFTDDRTAAVKGVDAVRRKPAEPMGLLRMRHCAGVDGEWVFVDADVLFQARVDPVFKSAFDIAVTTRDWSHVPRKFGFSDRMPFNTGVVFSRCPRFWQEVYGRLRHLDADQQHFMGEQQLICDVAQEPRYAVRQLSGLRYNFPPTLPDHPSPAEQEAAAAILHFKGAARKALMLERTKRGRPRCA